jgi:hypothetical protein
MTVAKRGHRFGQRRSAAQVQQPLRQVIGTAATSGVQWGEAVMTHPVHIGTAAMASVKTGGFWGWTSSQA